MSRRGERQALKERLGKVGWVDALSLFLGIVATILAVRANSIALRQYKSNMIVLDSKDVLYDFDGHTEDFVQLGYVERVRLANLGSAPDSIVSFDTIVYYKDTVSTFDGHGEGVNKYSLTGSSPPRISFEVSDELKSAIDGLETKIAEDYAFAVKAPINDNVGSLPLPLRVDGNSAIDVEMSLVVGVVPGNGFNVTADGDSLFPSQPKDLPPLEFEFVFHFASGTACSTPRLECLEIGKPE